MSSAPVRSEQGSCCDDRQDALWGRLPGAQPPLRWWVPAVVASVAALILTLVVVLVVRPPGPQDDPAAADQRDGLLRDGPQLPPAVDGLELGGRPVVVLFERSQPSGPAFDQWRSQVTENDVDLAVRVGNDGDELADLVGMPTPVDGGRPIGYAVIDPARQVRYATLDPRYLLNTSEVDVISGAVAGARR